MLIHPSFVSLSAELMCRGKAIQDFTGPDCRFVNFKKDEIIYVYYKLTGRSTELWAGSVSKYLLSLRGAFCGVYVVSMETRPSKKMKPGLGL